MFIKYNYILNEDILIGLSMIIISGLEIEGKEIFGITIKSVLNIEGNSFSTGIN